nr:hypothetical protein Iba_chr09eCG10850 [Ipomoea batatas]
MPETRYSGPLVTEKVTYPFDKSPSARDGLSQHGFRDKPSPFQILSPPGSESSEALFQTLRSPCDFSGAKSRIQAINCFFFLVRRCGNDTTTMTTSLSFNPDSFTMSSAFIVISADLLREPGNRGLMSIALKGFTDLLHELMRCHRSKTNEFYTRAFHGSAPGMTMMATNEGLKNSALVLFPDLLWKYRLTPANSRLTSTLLEYLTDLLHEFARLCRNLAVKLKFLRKSKEARMRLADFSVVTPLRSKNFLRIGRRTRSRSSAISKSRLAGAESCSGTAPSPASSDTILELLTIVVMRKATICCIEGEVLQTEEYVV